MSVTVTLHVFSGLPDPTWELSDEQAAELADRISRIHRQTLSKPPGVVGGLGYRGFSIESVREKALDPHVYVHAGIVDSFRFAANRISDDTELEAWLLSTAGTAVDQDVKDLVTANLSPGGASGPFASAGGVSALVVPPYDPGKWNNDPNILRRNNCYNYANDKITNTVAQPGRGSGRMFGALTCSDVSAAAGRDGQVPASSASSTPAQGHFIALVIWPDRDYHWYRLDDNARWSHKPGQTPARDTDESGATIIDPQHCNRGPYTSWCGYFHCIPANTRIS